MTAETSRSATAALKRFLPAQFMRFHRQHHLVDRWSAKALLHLLWRGIARYALDRKARLLVGCSSLTSQDPREGAAVYQQLQRKFLVKPAWQTFPQPIFGFPVTTPPGSAIPAAVPKLFRAYLTIGAKICGPPAIDSEFGTIDFLTLLDLQALPMIVRAHFLK